VDGSDEAPAVEAERSPLLPVTWRQKPKVILSAGYQKRPGYSATEQARFSVLERDGRNSPNSSTVTGQFRHLAGFSLLMTLPTG
jgi:hypothetical protein